jgi:TPR repeat protein
MRTSDVHHALMAAVTGSVMAIAMTGGPAHAQFFGFSFNFGGPPKPVASTDSGVPLPPANIPRAPVEIVDPATADPNAPAGSAAAAIAAVAPVVATPVAPDDAVATGDVPAPHANTPANAADAALTMANMMDGAGGGISNTDSMSALEDAAAAGQPMALWRLGTMYESGTGVAKDDVKAFGYFSQIANDHADAAPKGVDSDIVAQSFVKMSDYYKQGLPDAGIQQDPERAEQLIFHAATYFGNADAQYRIGEQYINDPTSPNVLQGARWLSLAAHKGHIAAQARLGDLLFNGNGLKPRQAEGLMWLSVANDRAAGTADEAWIDELLTRDMSVADPYQRQQATQMADQVESQFSPVDATAPGE